MDDHGSRRPEGVGPPLDDADASAVLGGLEGERQAGRTGTHHEDVRSFVHATSTRRHQSVESGRSSRVSS